MALERPNATTEVALGATTVPRPDRGALRITYFAAA
jgi:hypothetical protein